MTNNEEFEEWADSKKFQGIYRPIALQGYQARQPEIDALKAEVVRLEHNLDTLGRELSETEEENGHYERELLRLKAGAGKLRADAERYQHVLDENFKMELKFTPEADRDYFMDQMRVLHDAAMKETK